MRKHSAKAFKSMGGRYLARLRVLGQGFMLAVLTGIGCGSAARASGDSSDPLLNLLIQKGMITQQEAEKIRSEAEAIRTNGPAVPAHTPWTFGSAAEKLELFGDARVRYEDRTATDPAGGYISLQRFRYAVRLGLRGEGDHFYFGVRLEEASNPRSPWVTFGTSASGVPYQGPFGKSTSGINIGQVYLGWKQDSWLDLTVGKMRNPIYTTPMVWDTDINPEGLAERLKYSVGAVNFFGTFGQFIYEDTNPTHTSPGYFGLGSFASTTTGRNASTIPFLLAWQAGVEVHFSDRVSAKVAPVLYNYTGHGADFASSSAATPGFSDTYVGQGLTGATLGAFKAAGFSGFPGGFFDGFGSDQTGINDLLVLDIPAELNVKLDDKLNLRLFGDFAENLEGANRARAAFNAIAAQDLNVTSGAITPISSPQTHDNKAYQIGLAIGNKDSLGLVYGSTSRKHAWEARTYFQHIEQYALDPNLIDSDYFEGRENMEGLYTAVAYGLSDNVIATFRYGYARRINKALGTGGSNQDVPQMNPVNQYHILQLDLSYRF